MNRHGLALRDMDSGQRKLAYAIMASSLTSRAYEQATQIMDLEEVLGPLEKEQGKVSFDRDPALYYFTIFGKPGGEDPWAWRAEGHHVSLHFSVWGDKVISATPFFFGANPAEVRQGPKKGLRILSAIEDISFNLMNEPGRRTEVQGDHLRQSPLRYSHVQRVQGLVAGRGGPARVPDVGHAERDTDVAGYRIREQDQHRDLAAQAHVDARRGD